MSEIIKILLIEDDVVDQIFFQKALKASGINAELTVVDDVEKGIADFTSCDFTCVFLDYMLPGIDGLNLLKTLHAQKPTMPIVLITSHGDEKIAVEAMKAGAMDYISKNLITPPSLGQLIRNIIRFKEIEQQKINAENIVKQNERRHRIFFENNQTFLCTHTLDGNFIDVNLAGAKSLGYIPEDLIGRSFKEIISPVHENLFYEYMEKISSEKKAMGLIRVVTKSGEELTWLYNNYLYEEAGIESYIIGSVQDITERVKMEEEMHEARLLAEESVKTKEQFLANMSHEIRTPMSAILGFTNLILQTTLSSQQKEYLNTINYSAKNLLNIINDILDFSKINSGKLILEEADFSLSKVINSIFNVFQLEADKKNINLVCNLDENTPFNLKGDSVRLNQIFMNLFSNSIKFTNTGQITLNAKLLGRKEDHNIIEFSVEDTGIGIPENKLESVFDSFTQASSDTTRKYGGTGLGLSIVKNLVELHNGKIKAISKPGAGTKFVFTLQFKDGIAAVNTNENNSSHTIPTKQLQDLNFVKVLIVEDNPYNQLLAQHVLEGMGCEIDIAENGKQAIEKIEKNIYDIVLMDIQMPEMDGYEATRYIRSQSNEKTNKIPIIAMTAHALNDDDAKCIHAGMNDYISKPFEPEVLYSKIINLISTDQRLAS